MSFTIDRCGQIRFGGDEPAGQLPGLIADFNPDIASSIDVGAGNQTLRIRSQVGTHLLELITAGPRTGVESRNGRNVLQFSNANEEYLRGDTLGAVAASDYSVATAFRFGDIANLPAARVFVALLAWNATNGNNAGVTFLQRTGRCNIGDSIGDVNIFPFATFGPDEWHVIVYTVNNGTIDTYLDDVKVATIPRSFDSEAAIFHVGAELDGATAGDFFEGAIGRILIFDRKLTDSQSLTASKILQNEYAIGDAPLPYNDINDFRWWFDASREFTHTIAGDAQVAIIESSSTREVRGTALPSAFAPINIPNGLNFQAVWEFNGAGKAFVLPNSTHAVGNDDYTYTLLVRAPNATDTGLLQAGASSPGQFRLSDSIANAFRCSWDSNHLDVQIPDNHWHILTTTYDNSTGTRKSYIDGNLLGQDTANNRNTSTTNHTLSINAGSQNFRYAEGLCDNTPHSDTKVRNYAQYLRDKWLDFDVARLNPSLWLDAQDFDTLTLDPANKVLQWDDKGASGNNATERNPAENPEYVNQVSFPWVEFEGSQLMLLPDGTLPSGDSSYTIVVVMRPTLFTASNAIISAGSGMTANERLFLRIVADSGSNSFATAWWSNNLLGPNVNLNQSTILGSEYTSGGNRHHFNRSNTNVATDTPGTRNSPTTQNIIGNAFEGASLPSALRALVGEIIVIPGVLDNEIRGNLMLHLDVKWSPSTFRSVTFDSTTITYDSTIITSDAI